MDSQDKNTEDPKEYVERKICEAATLAYQYLSAIGVARLMDYQNFRAEIRGRFLKECCAFAVPGESYVKIDPSKAGFILEKSAQDAVLARLNHRN